MAVGDKTYIADKETLDDVHEKVGSTNNSGGTATSGTIFGKLNAIISSIASHVASWTAARATKVDNIDATVSSRQSEALAAERYSVLNYNTATNNTASGTGTLSQKLSHIINLFSTTRQKTLVSKVVNINIATAGNHTLLNVTGSGQFEFAYTDMGEQSTPITFEIDGNRVVLENLYQGYTRGYSYISHSLKSPGSFVSQWSVGATIDEIALTRLPLHFKNSLKITVATQNTTAHSFSANYAVYE